MVELVTGCGYGQECERKIKIKTEIKAIRCTARIQCCHEQAVHLEGWAGACVHPLMTGRASDADCGQAPGLGGPPVWPHATAPLSFGFPPYNSPSNCYAAHLGAVLSSAASSHILLIHRQLTECPERQNDLEKAHITQQILTLYTSSWPSSSCGSEDWLSWKRSHTVSRGTEASVLSFLLSSCQKLGSPNTGSLWH